MADPTGIDVSKSDTSWLPRNELELVAGTPAGGGQDRPARALVEVLGAQYPHARPIKLTNIPGRGGGNAWDFLRTRSGDAHVVAISSPTLISNRLLGVSQLEFGDLTPLANLYTEYPAFLVRADSSIRDGLALVDRLRADAAQIPVSLATAIGNTNHIALGRVTRHAGGNVRALNIEVFDSARYAIAELVAGKTELAVITAVSAVPELTSGVLRCLAIAAPSRLGQLFADVPTWREHGVDSVAGMWRGVIGPPGLSSPQVEFWQHRLVAASGCDAWKALLAQKYWADTFLTGPALREFLHREHDLMVASLGDLGLLTDEGIAR